jgi:hypothetical protein
MTCPVLLLGFELQGLSTSHPGGANVARQLDLGDRPHPAMGRRTGSSPGTGEADRAVWTACAIVLYGASKDAMAGLADA